MTIPVLTLFNNKGGVGKTSLVYHLAWILSQTGHRVLACDLDPQANLSAAFLDEEQMEGLWEGKEGERGRTIFACVKPLLEVGDVRPPALQEITASLKLIPGDLALSGFEDTLSGEWPNALGSTNLYRPFRMLTSFWTVMQAGAEEMDATVILADVGPNLGAINRSALIATDHVIVPLGADLFSLQGLRTLGPTLRHWREDWQKRHAHWSPPGFSCLRGAWNHSGTSCGSRVSDSAARSRPLIDGSTGCRKSTPEICSVGQTVCFRLHQPKTSIALPRSSLIAVWSRWRRRAGSRSSISPRATGPLAAMRRRSKRHTTISDAWPTRFSRLRVWLEYDRRHPASR